MCGRGNLRKAILEEKAAPIAKDWGHNLAPGNGEPARVLEQGSTHRIPLSHHSCLVSLPGRRGMVVVADRTSELYQKTYWASYNIPYVPPSWYSPPFAQLSVLGGGGCFPGDSLTPQRNPPFPLFLQESPDGLRVQL